MIPLGLESQVWPQTLPFLNSACGEAAHKSRSARPGEGPWCSSPRCCKVQASMRDCRAEASFRWCCKPPMCAKNDLVYLTAFANCVCFFCLQSLALSFSDLHLRAKTQKKSALNTPLPCPLLSSNPAWHQRRSSRCSKSSSRFPGAPPSSGVPQTCPGPANLLGLSLPKVARPGHSSPPQAPQFP